MTLSDLDFKVTTFLKSNIVKTARLKDKLLLHNRKLKSAQRETQTCALALYNLIVHSSAAA